MGEVACLERLDGRPLDGGLGIVLDDRHGRDVRVLDVAATTSTGADVAEVPLERPIRAVGEIDLSRIDVEVFRAVGGRVPGRVGIGRPAVFDIDVESIEILVQRYVPVA